MNAGPGRDRGGMRKDPKNKIKGGFVAMTWTLLNSKAYQKLPASAAKALPLFLGKVQDAPGPNNPARYAQDFSHPYMEAKRHGFGKSTFRNVICDLMKYGFIDMVRRGHYKTAGPQASTLFRLSRRWEHYGTPFFVEGDWRKYFPEKDKPERVKKEKRQDLKLTTISPETDQKKRGKRPDGAQ